MLPILSNADGLITKDALRIASLIGLDPNFSDRQNIASHSSIRNPSYNSVNLMLDLDKAFESVVSIMDGLWIDDENSESITTEKSNMEKIQKFYIPDAFVNPILSSIESQRSTFYDILRNNAIIYQSKKSKKNRKDKKKERKDKKKSIDLEYLSESDEKFSSAETNQNQIEYGQEVYWKLMTILIAKCLSENSIISYLIAIVILEELFLCHPESIKEKLPMKLIFVTLFNRREAGFRLLFGNHNEDITSNSEIIDADNCGDLSEEDLLSKALALSLYPSQEIGVSHVPSISKSSESIDLKNLPIDILDASSPLKYYDFLPLSADEDGITLDAIRLLLMVIVSCNCKKICSHNSLETLVEDVIELKFLPCPLITLSLEYLLNSAISQIYFKPNNLHDAKEKFRTLWNFSNLLECLKAQFLVSVEIASSANSLGFLFATSANNNETISDNIRKAILQFSVFPDAFYNSLDEQKFVFQNHFSECPSFIMHTLRKIGIDTLIEGFDYLYPLSKQEEIIRYFLSIDPSTYIDISRYNVLSSPEQDLPLCNKFYDLYTFQGLCSMAASKGYLFYNSREGINSSNPYNSILLDSAIISRLLSHFQYLYILFDREMFNKNDDCIIDNQFEDRKSLYFGEFQLIFSLQHFLLLKSFRLQEPSLPVNFDLLNAGTLVDSVKGSKNTIIHKGPKMWVTLFTNQLIKPNSGLYEITFHIEKSDRGKIQLGLASNINGTEVLKSMCLGSTKNSWSLCGEGYCRNDNESIRYTSQSLGSNDIVTMKYNSNNNELSFIINGNSPGIAFDIDSADDMTLYPAVSLYDKGDIVTVKKFIITNMIDHSNSNSNAVSTTWYQSERLIFYSQSLLGMCINMLDEEYCSQQACDPILILKHPYFSVLLASISSSFILTSANQFQESLFAMQLLPCFSIFYLKLSRFLESLQVKEQGIATITELTQNHIIASNWKFSILEGSQSFPPQEYDIRFEEAELNMISGCPKKEFKPIKLKGSGLGSSVKVEVLGTLYGSRVKFLEFWDSGGQCVVEGRLSLCGTFFNGEFSDSKLGKCGRLQGIGTFKTAQSLIEVKGYSKYRACKLLQLVANTCGKLCGVFIKGLSLVDYLTKKELNPLEIEVQSEVEKWIKSDLFSGGIPFNEELLERFFNDLSQYLFDTSMKNSNEIVSKNTNDAISCALKPDSISSPILKWWFNCIFPVYKENEALRFSDNRIVIPNIASCIISNESRGKTLDEYICKHIMQSQLLKIGGDELQSVRRQIIAMLIYHTGTAPLCEAVVDNVATKQDTNERPSSILLEIWNSGQRILEYILKIRQTSGKSYSSVCLPIRAKTDLLLEILPSFITKSLMDSFNLLSQELVGVKGNLISDSHIFLAKEVSKYLTNILEFLLSPIKNVDNVRRNVYSLSFTAFSRCAGLRSAALLVTNKDRADGYPEFSSLSPLPVLPLQANIMQWILLSLYGLNSLFDPAYLVKSDGNYIHNIFALNDILYRDLKDAFENIYEFNTQLLSRCTWASYSDGQCSTLALWGITISPADHAFLNRVSVFRILQMIFDELRPRNIFKDVDDTSVDKNLSSEVSQYGPFCSMLTKESRMRLSDLALRVIHSLASQVVFSKLQTNSILQLSVIPKLVMNQSGPDTLSMSLFDMLFSELSSNARKIIISTLGDDELVKLIDSKREMLPEDCDRHKTNELEESQIMRILKLLYFSTESATCLRYLSSPKWLSLFFSILGCGSIRIQKRLYRLLGRLFIFIKPENFRALVPNFFSIREEFSSNEELYDDSDIETFIESNCESSISSLPESFIVYLIDSMTLHLPMDSTSENKVYSKKFHEHDLANFIASESLFLLRILLGCPSWNEVIISTLLKLKTSHDNDGYSLLRRACCNSIVGGEFNRFRLGGLVQIKHQNVISPTDSVGIKLSSLSQTTGVLLSLSKVEDAAEVLLATRGIKTQSNTKSSNYYDRYQYVTKVPGKLPFTIVKLKLSQLFAISDGSLVPSSIGESYITYLCESLRLDTLPWLKSTLLVQNDRSILSQCQENETEDDVERQHLLKTVSEDISNVNPSSSLTSNELINAFAHLGIIKSFSQVVHNNSVSEKIGSDSIDIFLEFLIASTNDSTCGGLDTLESAEEKFVELWDTCFLFSKPTLSTQEVKSPQRKSSESSNSVSSVPIVGILDPESRRLVVEDFDILRFLQQRDSSGSRAILGDPASAASVLLSTLGGLGRTVDAETREQAVTQMMDMGIQREWCEAALRRCRYNVEMAINLCFEHGDDMARLVAEDEAMMSMQATRNESGVRRRLPVLSGQVTSTADSSSNSRNARPISVSSESEATENIEGNLRQLTDMGFPTSWCSRALAASQNNVTAALAWILHHGDELEATENTNRESSELTSSNEDISESTKEDFNPLSIVSGHAIIEKDLTCSPEEGFPTVGCSGFAASSGKWYYEVTLLTAGCIQIGWVDNSYQGSSQNGSGVGDDKFSWAFDGWRMFLWHEISTDWGSRWAVGDVVGCAIDLDNRLMHFYLNGMGQEIDMGLAFSNFDFFGGMYPCASFNKKEKVKFNFGNKPFKYQLPGYRAFNDHVKIIIEKSQKDISKLSQNENSIVSKINDYMERNLYVKDDINYLRYFEEDKANATGSNRLLSISNVNSRPHKLPEAVIDTTPSDDRQLLYKKILMVLKDLYLLYSRKIVLILVQTLFKSSNATSSYEAIFNKFDNGNEHSSALGKLFDLFKMSSIHSPRTSSYISSSSYADSLYSNDALSKMLMAGGQPFLYHISFTISRILTVARLHLDTKDSIVKFTLSQISKDMFHLADWSDTSLRIDNGGIPHVILKDVSSKTILSSPSLQFSVYLTNVLMKQLIKEISDDNSDYETHSHIFLDLLSSWVIGLRSSSLLAKTCCMQVLSSIIEEILSIKLIDMQKKLIQEVSNLIPFKRLQAMASERLQFERPILPICSEYLQSLLELLNTISHCTYDSEIFDADIPQVECNDDEESSMFNWEVSSGRLFADGGDYVTWSGTVSHYSQGIISNGSRKFGERHEHPPELFPGCKVSRKVTRSFSKAVSVPSSEKLKDIDEETVEDVADTPLGNTNEHLSHVDTNSEAPAEIETRTIVEYGTVLDICTWDNDIIGSARTIQWDNGDIEKVRWGAKGGIYDVSHVKLSPNGRLLHEYPLPTARENKLLVAKFGQSCSFGIILRLRLVAKKSDDDSTISHRVVGILEWPDFHSTVFVKGNIKHDGSMVLFEKKLLSGPLDMVWTSRFATPSWRSGTKYLFLDFFEYLKENRDLTGRFSYDVTTPLVSATIRGNIKLQRSHLFTFDPRYHSSNVVPSWNKLSVCKNSPSSGSHGCIFGNIGFSSGIHYWEFKIEQADVGSVFIGVSEKIGMIPGIPSSCKSGHWTGFGFIGNRSSFQSNPMTSTERVRSYGDHFMTGDLVGVMLDLNKGRLSFFLDGMKYGEHILSDLGDAFDNLSTNSSSIIPKVFYPIVGLSRHQDRVTITPKWFSHAGIHHYEESKLINRAWRLLATWKIERQTTAPSDYNMWIYREAWREWRRWMSGRFMRVKTRCKSASILVDISPRMCVQASIMLGLPFALFHGDRISLSLLSGKKLPTLEEAVVLGAYNNQIWYRHDYQHGSTSSVLESTNIAWSLAPNDIEGLSILRRSTIQRIQIPAEVVAIELPRIPAFRSGIVTLTLKDGAAMRNGLEIDTSDMIKTVPKDTTLYAIEKRMNSSNILRHKVIFDGYLGWISERMRGGAEEMIIDKHIVSIDALNEARDRAVEEANTLGITDRIVWQEADSIDHAMQIWSSRVCDIGFKELLNDGEILSMCPIENEVWRNRFNVDDKCMSCVTFVEMAATTNGDDSWSAEADMQLAEYLAKCSATECVSPYNLSFNVFYKGLDQLNHLNTNSLLKGIPGDRMMARAALLKVANQIIGYALPYINLNVFEEKLCQYSDNLFSTKLTKLQDSCSENAIDLSTEDRSLWRPDGSGRRLRNMRRILFSQTKRSFWESILESTTTITPMQQDEYEDPREIKTISINRIKATSNKLAEISNINDRFRQSVFGQLFSHIRLWNDSSFRRSYIAKGHGGQRRSFKVKFLGEGVNDYGGPYRAVFEQIIDELQCDHHVLPSGKTLFPLLVPSNNRGSSVGLIQDKFVLSTHSVSASDVERMNFFGKLLGIAVRQNFNLALDLSEMTWRPLVKFPVSRRHLESIDTLVLKSLEDITNKGLQLENEVIDNPNYFPEEWQDICFVECLSDGTRVPLIESGEEIQLNVSNWRLYVQLVERIRLRESLTMFKALRDGLATVIPIEILPLFTPSELEQLVCGSSHIDINILKQCTEYENIDPNSETVKMFWEVLEEFSMEERVLFLRFVWARSRMPTSIEDLPINFKLQAAQTDGKSKSDDYLPHAQTCFFSLAIPSYSSKQILREKLLYAIHNSPTMDADVRLHSAEGWE